MNYRIIPDPKACPNCGEEILFGRADRKYCTDACRTDYNNKLKMEKRLQNPELVKTISKILINNYQVLRMLNTKGKTFVSEKKLRDLGFDFNYLTGYYTTKEGKVYHYLFDQGYLKTEEGEVLLVVRDKKD